MSELHLPAAQDLTDTYSRRKVERLVFASVAAGALLLAGTIYVNRAPYALLALAATGALVLANFPRYAFYLFLVSLAIYAPRYLSPGFAAHPFDILMAVVLMAMVMDFLLRGRTEIRPTAFDWPFIALIIATVVSAVLAYDPSYSIFPLIRIIFIYLAFRAVFKFGVEIGARKVVLFYLGLVFILSLYNVGEFFVSGGRMRIFGPATLAYETFSMTAFPMALAFLIWSEKGRDRLKFGIVCTVIGFGILATQSRAPLLAVVIAAPVLVILSALKARREKTHGPLRTTKMVILLLLALGVFVLVLRQTFFAGSLGRYEQFLESLTRPQGTVAYRITQWTAALKAFSHNPLFGVGIGNFRIVEQIYPELRVTPYFVMVKGMSAHNVFLHYLAETGLFGTLALLALAWKGFRTGYRAFRQKLSAHDNQVSAALMIAMVVFCMTIFYMRVWTWGQDGYVMSLIFGLTAAWVHETK